MEITLITDGRDHYVFSYGKQDLPITQAPVSILKKIVSAKCFKVILPPKDSNELPAIKLRADYHQFSQLEPHYDMMDQNGLTSYNLNLCTRQNELFQHYSKLWDQQLYTVNDLIKKLNQQDPHRIGANFDKTGIQFFIENKFTDLTGKNIEGKKLHYPFLLHEVEEDLASLKEQSADFI